MASDATGDALDQIVYRWSYEHLLGGRGMGPVATSLTPDRLRDWHGGLDNHVSMDRSFPETPAWSFSRVRLEERHALILREAAIHGTNRPGTNAHVLLDPTLGVSGHRMLATAWLHERQGGGLTGSGVPLADVPENVPMRTGSIRPDSVDRAVCARIREQARAHAELLEVVLAAVLRDHLRTFTLHLHHVGPDIVPLLWGVFDLAQPLAPGMWTFSTYETSDASLKPRFVLVPRWPNTPEPSNRLRIDPRAEPQPGQDVFRDAAGFLVQLYCTRPWAEVDALLLKLEQAAGKNASYADVADLVLRLEADRTGAVRTVGPGVGLESGSGVGSGAGPVTGPVAGPYGDPAAQGADDLGVIGYTETWITGDAQDESHESYELPELHELHELHESDTPGEPDRDGFGRATPRPGRAVPVRPERPDEPDEPDEPWQGPSAGAGGAGPMPSFRPTVGGGGPFVPIPPRPDRLAAPPAGRTARPAPGDSGGRPVLPTNPSANPAGRGSWDRAGWERLGAGRNGFTALDQAARQLARSGGQPTREFHELLARVDPATLAVALLLARPPLLAPVVHLLDRLLDRDDVAGVRQSTHTRETYARVLGRLHEDINTLDGCGAPRETVCRLVGTMTRLTVGDGKRTRFGGDVLPTLGTDIAGTVWALRTSLKVWADYQCVLRDGLRASPRHRESYLLELGRLVDESFRNTPHRTEPQP
ncbi:hypothetical protein [Embleya sp. AB8]|uniref:hypothetical protein n=1 Tax=Embleya sp. AB8 TaxID=3156304 RepID=UPI003C7345D2